MRDESHLAKELYPPEATTEFGGKHVSFDFVFETSNSSADLPRLRNALEGADIYIPDWEGFDSEDEKNINRLSAGQITPEQLLEILKGKKKLTANEQDFFAKLQVIQALGVAILFPVTMENGAIHGQAEAARKKYIYEDLVSAKNSFLKGDYASAVAMLPTMVRTYAQKGVVARNEFIAENLPKKIQKVLDENPQFKKQTNIRTVITTVFSNSSLMATMKNGLPESEFSGSYSEGRLAMSYVDELTKRAVFKKEISAELCSKVLASLFLNIWLTRQGFGESQQQRVLAVRAILDPLSAEQEKNISEKISKKIPFEVCFEEAGNPLPQSLEELLNRIKK